LKVGIGIKEMILFSKKNILKTF